VLGEVRDAAVLRVLVARPGGEEDVTGDRLRVGQRRREDAKAVGQGLTLEHAHALSLLLMSSLSGTDAPLS
jgi:hypothetical protein